jgi:hypothetical protein
VTRSGAALLTGSSRQRLNGFIGHTQSRVGSDGPRFVIPRQTFVPRCHGSNFVCRAVRDEELGPLRPSILNGKPLNPVNPKGALPPAYPPSQTCRRPMVLHRKSNAGTMNPHRSSGDEWVIADTQLKPARTDNTVSWLAINDSRSDKCRMLLSIFTAAKSA